VGLSAASCRQSCDPLMLSFNGERATEPDVGVEGAGTSMVAERTNEPPRVAGVLRETLGESGEEGVWSLLRRMTEDATRASVGVLSEVLRGKDA
jgi:hypothetical protein